MGEGLNGAYYGPSIPPPKHYHRPGRGGGGCCCNPFSCCCSCLCSCIGNCILQILITIVVIVGIICLIGWLIFRPNEVKFYATDASLTEFNLNNNNTLHYNLALNMTIRNPNRRIGIYYDRIEARTFYEGQRFESKELPHFYQGHKSTDYLNSSFKGQRLLLLGDKQVSNYNSDKNSGEFDINVELYLRIRLKFLVFKTGRLKPKIKCELKIPLTANGTSPSSQPFESKRCDFDWK